MYLKLIIIVIIIIESNSLHLCNLTSTTNIFNSTYKYKLQKWQNCNSNCKNVCIRKCCALGYEAGKGVCVKNQNNNYLFSVPIYNEQNYLYHLNITLNDPLIVGVMNCDFFALVPNYQPLKDLFYIQENSDIWTYSYGLIDNKNYCIDNLKDNGLSAFVCYMYDSLQIILERVNVIGMIISMPFLLTTFIVYALLPDRNLHMKALMSYVINLLFGYLLLVIIQLTKSKFSFTSCITLGYFCVFFFMVSFFWMNVICIDIWFAFSGLRGFSRTKNAECKRFLMYCVYAWGMSILHVLIVFIIDKNSNEKHWYNPGIGSGQCFLQTGYSELLYFYGPMGILITINVILFVVTAIKIRSIKKDTSMLKNEDNKRHSYENDKRKFNLYLKLLFAMGVNWSLEIISWAVNWKIGHVPAYIWYLTDFCNATYGVFIFFIFVFKKSIWILLKKRYYSFIGKPHLAHSMTQNQTRVTSYSTTNISMHEQGLHNRGGPVNDNTTLTSET